MEDLEAFRLLGIALALGLLIGLERGWEERDLEEGERVAGLRTFGAIALLGGVLSLVAKQVGPWVIGFGFLGLSVLLAVAYGRRSRVQEDIGATSIIAALLAYALGALVLQGYPAAAAAAAVVVAIMLGLKPSLHAWVQRLERRELRATLQLALISVVLLPVLPDQGYGPWQALNPYEIWWMVVLIAAISFVGYFSIKIAGVRHGPVVTGMFGGLAASTATTLNLARLARESAGMNAALVAGILAASGTMFPRVLIVAAALDRTLFLVLLPALAVMALASYGLAFAYWRAAGTDEPGESLTASNPFQLSMALKFGALLVAILLLSEGLKATLGDKGLYALAAVSGLADVDAITLSLSRMSAGGLDEGVAALAIIIAVSVNSLVKGGLAYAIAGNALGWRVMSAMLAIVALGLAVAWGAL